MQSSSVVYDSSCALLRYVASLHHRPGDSWPDRYRWFMDWNSPLSPAAQGIARHMSGAVRFNATDFLQLVAGTDVHVLGDSLADNLRYSLSAMLACSLNDSRRFRVQRDGLEFTRERVSVDRLATHFFVKERLEQRSSNSSPAWYMDEHGHSRSMRSSSQRYVVLLNESGLGEWANPPLFQQRIAWPSASASHRQPSCRLVIVVAGQWFHPRSDVDLYGLSGEPMPRDAFLTDAYRHAVRLAIAWFDRTLDERGLVAWLSYSPHHHRCDRANSSVSSVSRACAANAPADVANAILQFELRSRAVAVDRSRRASRQTFIDITGRSACFPEGHLGCAAGRDGRDGLHWALPGVPDGWVRQIYEALRQHANKARCGTR